MVLATDRRLPHDWFDGVVPAAVDIEDEAYVESAFSFTCCRAQGRGAIRIARGAHIYSATLFDVGERGSVAIGEGAMLNGARIVCDRRVAIGAFATVSWNVMLLDNYRVPFDPTERREHMARAAARASTWQLCDQYAARPIVLEDNVWLGFDVCVLPGVRIGEGAVVGARSVVRTDVPAYTVVAGNPARVVRTLPRNVAPMDEARGR